ncbi:hypothetical protein D3C87_657880 [compost metagenome]
MASTNQTTPPNLPLAPIEYDRNYQDELNKIFRLFFVDLTKVGPSSISRLNIGIDTLPTEADLANLRSGDVYRDTTAGNVLKIKP